MPRWRWSWASPWPASPGGRGSSSCGNATGAGWPGNVPARYWTWANLAALTLSAGPVLGAGLAQLRRGVDRAVLLLTGAAATAVLIATVSQMSRAEVERIWLPFIPWLLVSTALLPARWRAPLLALQLAVALVMEHLLYTTW